MLGMISQAALAADQKITKANSATLPMMPITGWALLPDGQTLVLATQGQLIYVDTMAGKELKRVELEFPASAMAIKGNLLYVAAKGAARLYEVEAATGKVTKELKVPNAPIVSISAHPKEDLLLGATGSQDIVAVWPGKGEVVETEGKGEMVAIDPVDGHFFYTMFQPAKYQQVSAQRLNSKQVRINVKMVGDKTVLIKYAWEKGAAKEVTYNNDSVITPHALAVSTDGKRVAVVGGGGWRPKKAAGAGMGGYVVPLFDAEDSKTPLGQIELGGHPQNVAFHPGLDLGVAERSGGTTDLVLFKSRTAAPIKKLSISPVGSPMPLGGALGFCAKGSKLFYFATGKVHGGEGNLYLIPLDLSDADKAALAKAYP